MDLSGFNDYERAYFNTELKQELLKLLYDTTAYAICEANNAVKISLSDSMYHVEMVKVWLKKNNKIQIIDTVLKDKKLFQLYLDSVMISYYQESYSINSNHKDIISEDQSRFLADFKYKEVYDYFHSKWLEENKPLEGLFFDIMIKYQDPEAIDLYMLYVDSAYRKQDKYALYDIVQMTGCRNLFSYNLFKYLFDKDVEVYSGYDPDPFEPISLRLFKYIWGINIEIYFVDSDLYEKINTIMLDFSESKEEQKKEILQLKDRIFAAVDKLIILSENNNFYWKQNMPYYKKEE